MSNLNGPFLPWSQCAGQFALVGWTWPIGPKNYRFEIWDPDFVLGNDIYKYLEYLWAI